MSNSRVIDIPAIENFLQDLFQSNNIKEFAEQFANFFYHKSENLKKLNNSFKTPENTEYLYSYQHLGNFVLDNQRELPLILFHLQPNKIINDRQGKKTQFDIIKKWLKQNNYDSAIAIFVSNSLNAFRISYVYSIYSGSKRTFSHYKRYSFYIAQNLPNKTFIQRLSQYPIDSEKNIIELFSVDKLTKEFYEEIQTWYYEALKHVHFPEDVPIQENPKNATNLIRLLTRLIFCWFIKERGIIPDELFKPTELSQILKEFNKDKNSRYYYNAILQNLFFASLNTPREKRDFAIETNDPEERKKHFGVKNLYRYKDFFNISKEEAIKLFQGVPFLNGGLFDCLDKEDIQNKKAYYIDGFSRNPEKQAIVPDWLFFHDDPITVDLSEFGLGKKTFKGLIDILKSYNFTTDENSPIDEEVALDPELLGHIFENLLASFNPETANTARKSSGSYYTPREIVDYMVTESLFYYFQTHCPEIAEDKIRLLLSYSDEKINLSDSEKKRLIEAIFKIKVLDPACGSGAFPMGVLHKLVFVLQKIDPENQYWKKEILSDVTKKFEQTLLNIKTKEEREKIFKELNEVFENNTDDYSRKLFLIENCIYGVDIQNIAIQISKLRFFISLFIEQDINDQKANYGLKPLPNLETKFVVANTLIGLDKPAQLSLRNQEIEALETKLKDLRHRYFTIQTREEKLSIQKEDKSIREKIAEHLIKDGWGDFTAHKIAAFDPYDQNASADWFDPEWMFGITDGFDIVIGNPPYIDSENMVRQGLNEEREYISKNYYFARGNWDIYIAFFEKGFELLNNEGILTFITPDKWLTKPFGEEMRKRSINKISSLVMCGRDVFESSNVDAIISIFSEKVFNNIIKIHESKNKRIIFKNSINKSILTPPYNLDFIFSDYLGLLLKIENVSFKLSDFGKCENACATSDAYKLKPLIKELKDKTFDKEIFLKVINTGTIGKYSSKWGKREMTYLGNKYVFPVVDKNEFIKTFNDTYKKRVFRPKIVIKGLTLLDACIDLEGLIIPGKSTLVVNAKDIPTLKLLLVIINSKLASFYLKEKYPSYTYNQGINFTKDMINSMPFPKISNEQQKLLITLVDQILSAQKQNPQADTSEYENEINKLVYKLYDLSEEEIKIIEK